MKMRLFRTLVVFVMWAVASMTWASAPLWGDLNGDGVITAVDISMAVNDIAEGQYWVEHDLNEDSEINAADLSTIVNIAAGLDNEQRETAYKPSGTLPVLHIDIEGYVAVTSKDVYSRGTYWLDPCGQPGVQALGSESKPLSLQIKGRGNYSWIQKKKPYRLKLDKKAAMAGMPPSKHWTLLAHVRCPLNNTMGFKAGRLLGMDYVPNEKPVEVVMNGRYIGLYFLTEKIRVESGKVDIEEQEDGETDPEKVTGGWLLEIDNSYDPDHQIIVKHPKGRTLMITYHSPEELSEVQHDYISTFLNDVNNAIYGDSVSAYIWDRIDVDALVRYYITQEIICNPESFLGSCFMSKERGEDTKLVFGPLWDMENAFWHVELGNDNCTHDFIFNYPDSPYLYHWIDRLHKDPVFCKRLYYQYKEFYNDHVQELIDYVADAAQIIRPGVMADFKRWPDFKDGNFDGRILLFQKWLREKAEFLRTQWLGKHIGDEPTEKDKNR